MAIDFDELESILENENNTILNKTYKNIKSEKNNILQQLNLNKDRLTEYTNKLKDYRYIDEISDIVYGNFCRWINLTNNDIKLEQGGFISDINISNNGPLLTIKIFNRYITINANNILLFQKINNQERILLKVMKYIEK